MNSIILTALENKCSLHSISFLDLRMTKSTKLKIEKPNIKIVYHCSLQVHSICSVMLSCYKKGSFGQKCQMMCACTYVHVIDV